MTIADVYVAIATYTGLEQPGVPVLVAVGDTAERAEAALEVLIDDHDNPDGWDVGAAELHGVAQADAGGTPAWRLRTEEEQEQLAIAQMEEVQDCAKELAHEMLDALDAEGVQEFLDGLNDEGDDSPESVAPD